MRTPPADLESEAIVLGSMMLGGAMTSAEVRQAISAGDFYRPAHADIFEAICSVADAREPVEYVVVRNALTAAGKLEAIGGEDYLDRILEGTPSAANAGYYAGVVRDKARLRTVITIAGELADMAYGAGAEAPDVVGELQRRAYELAVNDFGAGTQTAAEAASGVLADAESGRAPAVSLGYSDIDRCSGGGLRPGQLVVVAAGTSVGKTSLGLCFALKVASGVGSVKFFSHEMSRAELAQRLLSMLGEVNGLRIASGHLDAPQWDSLRDAQKKLDTIGRRFELTDRPLDMAGMEGEVQRMAMRTGRKVDLVVVDYLQLVPTRGGATLREKINAVTRGCKMMARSLETPVVLLSQLSRTHQAENRPPELRDLKESSNIEQDADGVILLYRDPTAAVDPFGIVEVSAKVAKWRNGMTTTWKGEDAIQWRFRPETTEFLE